MVSWHESDIEEYICENYEEVFGDEYFFIGRQINVGIGVIDVLLYDITTNELVVVEIKNKNICNNALSQILRYMRGVLDYIGKDEWLSEGVLGVSGILLGPDINQDTMTAVRAIKGVWFYQTEVKIVVNAEPINITRNEDLPCFKPEEFNKMIHDFIDEVYRQPEPPEEAKGQPEEGED